MGALLDDFTIFKYNDLVGIFGRRDPVAYDQSGLVLGCTFEIVQDFFLGFGVHSGQAIIKKIDFRVFEQCPCNRDPLLLSPA